MSLQQIFSEVRAVEVRVVKVVRAPSFMHRAKQQLKGLVVLLPDNP